MCLLINKECRELEMKSLLKRTVVSDLEHYKWNSVLKKWTREAPTFYRILKTIAVPPTISRNHTKKHLLKPIIIRSAGAILLKGEILGYLPCNTLLVCHFGYFNFFVNHLSIICNKPPTLLSCQMLITQIVYLIRVQYSIL